MVDHDFTVSMRSISRRLEDNGGDGVFLLVKVPGVKGSPDALVADVQAAMERANAALDRGDDVDVVWAEGVMPTMKGPMINLDWVGTDEQNEEWLDTFAEAMQAAGRSGSITAAPQEHLPKEIGSDYFRRSRLSAYLAYSLTAALPPHEAAWRVDDQVTDRICRDAVAWGAFEGAEVYLSEGIARVRVATPEVAESLATAVRRSWSARVIYLAKAPLRSRIITLGAEGEVTYQVGGDGQPWAAEMESLRQALLQAPTELDHAYVRRRSGFGDGVMDLGSPYPLKELTESNLRYNRHLWNRFVPDSFGMQVLTRSHLDKANDLSAWNVREVAPDRFLVEAPDLQPWFEPEVPDQELIDAARADFGAMILTRADIENDPNGWLPGRPFRTAAQEPGR